MNAAISEGSFSNPEPGLPGYAAPYQPADADLQLLAEIGLSAAVKGSVEISKPIFDALSLSLPDHPIASIGMALAHLSEGDADTAIRLLKPVHQKEPSSSEAAAVLLIALTVAERWDEARSVKRNLLNGPDGPGKSIAIRLAPIIES